MPLLAECGFSKAMVLRASLGVLVGLGYGVLVGAVIFLVDRVFGNPGPDLMLDSAKIASFVILLTMTVTGAAGALVGLIVGLLGMGKPRAALTGFCIGLLVLFVVLLKTWPRWAVTWNEPISAFGFLLFLFLVLAILLPIGLAATGVMTSIVVRRVGSA